ncbi:MAG: PilZ domain-containing protein [Oligoflexia bacterium]|nr:PilZ domain-containing protein [Oligoflexia bacterium]
MKPIPSEIEEVHDIKVVERYIKYAEDMHIEVFLFFNGNDETPLEGTLKPYALRANPNEINFEISQTKFSNLSEDLRKSINSQGIDIKGSFSVNEILFVFHANLLVLKGNSLRLLYHTPFYRIQRRASLRYKIPKAEKVEIEISGQLFSLFDLSASGFSIVGKEAELLLIEKNQTFKKCKFKFHEKECFVDVKAMSRFFQENKMMKIGFKFLNLNSEFDRLIARAAYLHSQKFWSRWI